MKIFLLSLIISFNCFAQFRVEIHDLDGKLTNAGEFETLDAANSWILENSPTGAFGRPEKIVQLDGANDEDRALAVEVIPANEERGTPSMLRTRKAFEIIGPTDVTAQRTQENSLASAMAKAQRAMECGKSAQALLLVRNSLKNLTTAAVKALVAAYAPIKQLLDTGSLQSSIEEIQAVQADGVLITNDDKTALVNHINGCKPQAN